MAISKLKPRHASEGRSIAAVLKDRLDYDKNPEKTDGGLLVTGYQCSPDTAWQGICGVQADLYRYNRAQTCPGSGCDFLSDYPVL